MNIKIIDYGYENLPRRSHPNDAGADVYSLSDISIDAHETVKIPLGFGLELPTGFMALVMPRSGLSAAGVTAELAPVDAGYTGEIHAIVTNNSDEDKFYVAGSRVAQLVVMPIIIPTLVEEHTFDAIPTRDGAGFGSTGV